MYESSVGVPMVAAGPGVADRTVEQPVSLLDWVPTFADETGVDPDPEWRGESLLPLLDGEPEDDDRTVFSEYHAHGTSHGMYMIRRDDWKYVYYPHNPPQLFDVAADPGEMENLADDRPAVVDDLYAELAAVCEPDAVDARALEEQAERLRELE
jgi:choline-sulfatase